MKKLLLITLVISTVTTTYAWKRSRDEDEHRTEHRNRDCGSCNTRRCTNCHEPNCGGCSD